MVVTIGTSKLVLWLDTGASLDTGYRDTVKQLATIVGQQGLTAGQDLPPAVSVSPSNKTQFVHVCILFV